MLNDIVLNSIIVTIETLTYRKSIADKLISSSHGYPTFTDWALVLKDEQVSPDRKVMAVHKVTYMLNFDFFI